MYRPVYPYTFGIFLTLFNTRLRQYAISTLIMLFSSIKKLKKFMLVICRSGFCFLLMFRSTFLLLTCRDCHFHIQQKVFLLASDMSSQKRKAYETDDEFKDSSDFKCVSASYCLWKKSGPASASVKQRYKKEYRDTWPFLGPSTKGKHHVFCQLCEKYFLRR